MIENSNTDTNPEPSKPKNTRYKVILKAVFKGVSIAWSMYRAGAKVIDFFKEIVMD